MFAMVYLITGVSIVFSTVCSGAHQRNHQSSASLAFVRGIQRWPVNPPHKGPVTRKMFPFVIMASFGLVSVTTIDGPIWRHEHILPEHSSEFQTAVLRNFIPSAVHLGMARFKLLWLSDAIWWRRSGSALACCVAASIHYPSQCWRN